jgi:phage tail-like protein
MVTRSIRRPAAASAFHLEIEGTSAASFVRCSGLGGRVSVLELVEGGSTAPRKFPGDSTYQNILLERGVLRDRELFDWYARGDRRDGSIVLLSAAGVEVCRWSFVRGWACRWEGPTLDARSPEVALELVEIAHEGLQCLVR